VNQPDYVQITAERLLPRDRLLVGKVDRRIADVYRVRGNVNAEAETGELFSFRPADQVTVHRITHALLAAPSVGMLDTRR
jgi:hypothetical protein